MQIIKAVGGTIAQRQIYDPDAVGAGTVTITGDGGETALTTFSFVANGDIDAFKPVYIDSNEKANICTITNKCDFITIDNVADGELVSCIKTGIVVNSFGAVGNLWLSGSTVAATPNNAVNSYLQLVGVQITTAKAIINVEQGYIIK